MKIQDIDKNFSKPKSFSEPDILFVNVKNKPFEIYGLITSNPDDAEYRRIPKDVAETISPEVTRLSTNTAGGRVRFSTNSDCIAIRVNYDSVSILPNMTPLATLGFDIYQTVNGKDSFIGAFAPPPKILTGEAKEYEGVVYLNNPDEEMLSYTIHFPLYHNVRSLEIGFNSNADVESGVSYINPKPVVYYGSSITQGGCASHPGNAYENIISSLTNTNHVNLGFSGSARGEKLMAEYIASLDMSVFVCDYDYNARSSIELKERHEPFFKIIRQAHPDLPIILISNPTPNYSPKEERRREAILETYNNALAAGDKNVYFIDGEKFFSKDFPGCYTTDIVHPNDAGFIHMANRIGKDVAKALNIDWPY